MDICFSNWSYSRNFVSKKKTILDKYISMTYPLDGNKYLCSINIHDYGDPDLERKGAEIDDENIITTFKEKIKFSIHFMWNLMWNFMWNFMRNYFLKGYSWFWP